MVATAAHRRWARPARCRPRSAATAAQSLSSGQSPCRCQPICKHLPKNLKNTCGPAPPFLLAVALDQDSHNLKNPAVWPPNNLETARPKNLKNNTQDSGQVPQGVRLAHSTVNRLLKQAGLMDRPRADGRERRRYQWSLANELWQADLMYGPKIVRTPGRRKARAYLAAIPDDATRVLPHAEFTFSEGTEHFLPVLRQAVLRRGIPLRLYLDNGSTFRSKHLQVVCAQLGASLIHSRPYQPQGRGKIERFFRRVRTDFLSELELSDDTCLEDLNRHLAVWIEGEYHHVPHHGLDGETPLDRWAQVSHQVRFAGPDLDLQRMFCLRFPRRVSLAQTVSLHGRTYETDASLIGESVVLLQDPGAPPSRPMVVLHRNREAGLATLLDLHANARMRRKGPPGGDPPAPDADNQEPDADPDDPRPAPLALRTLDAED